MLNFNFQNAFKLFFFFFIALTLVCSATEDVCEKKYRARSESHLVKT